MSEAKKPKDLRVVAALIRDREKSSVLLTQRKPGRHLGLAWEFPGGKVEVGENDAEALIREMHEELGVKVEVGTLCFETRHHYGPRDMHLLVYRCKIVEGNPKALDVNAMEWVAENELLERTFLPADMPLVRGISQGLIAFDEDSDDEPSLDDGPVQCAVISRPKN